MVQDHGTLDGLHVAVRSLHQQVYDEATFDHFFDSWWNSDGFAYIWIAGHGDGSYYHAVLAGDFHAGCRCG